MVKMIYDQDITIKTVGKSPYMPVSERIAEAVIKHVEQKIVTKKVDRSRRRMRDHIITTEAKLFELIEKEINSEWLRNTDPDTICKVKAEIESLKHQYANALIIK